MIALNFVERILTRGIHIGDAVAFDEALQRRHRPGKITGSLYEQRHATFGQAPAKLAQALKHEPAPRRSDAMGIPLRRAETIERRHRLARGQSGIEPLVSQAKVIPVPDQLRHRSTPSK